MIHTSNLIYFQLFESISIIFTFGWIDCSVWRRTTCAHYTFMRNTPCPNIFDNCWNMLLARCIDKESTIDFIRPKTQWFRCRSRHDESAYILCGIIYAISVRLMCRFHINQVEVRVYSKLYHYNLIDYWWYDNIQRLLIGETYIRRT